MQPSDQGSQRFGSERRLLQRAEFQRVFDAGAEEFGETDADLITIGITVNF